MKAMPRKTNRNECGQALVAVLGLLVIGGLTITPVLAHVKTGVQSIGMHREKADSFYVADAGIEHGAWRLLYEEGFAESFTAENPSVEYTANVSDATVSIRITKVAAVNTDTLSLDVDYVMPAGHQLELRATVQEDDHCVFAYDTTSYDSWLNMPVPSGSITYYLHDNPTPPVGDTNHQADLPMDDTAPTAEILYNYDQDRDALPGRRVEEASGDIDELEVREYLNWLTAPYPSDVHHQGTVVINLYIAPDGFNFDNEGEFTAYLRDYDPLFGTYTEIVSQTYEVGEGEWVEPWHSTAPEGKYEIIARAGDAQVNTTIGLRFGYLRILSYAIVGTI